MLLIITLDCFATFSESRLLFAHKREHLLAFYSVFTNSEMGDYRFETSQLGFSITKFKISVKTCNMFDCYLTLLDFFFENAEKKQFDNACFCYSLLQT